MMRNFTNESKPKTLTIEILDADRIQRLTDDALWEKAKFTARFERELSLQLIELVREVIARSLHLKHSHQSVFTYLVKELGFSEGSASRRLHALKVFESTPALQKEVREGAVTLSQVALFHQVKGGITEEEIQQFRQKTTEETKKILVEEFNVSPEVFSKNERITPRRDESSTLTFTVDSSFLKDMRELQELASHALCGSKELKTTFQYALTRALQELRRKNGMATNLERKREVNQNSATKSESEPIDLENANRNRETELPRGSPLPTSLGG